MQQERKIYALSQLTTSLENFISKHFFEKAIWVTAEITKVSTKGGHYYLELAETENWQLLAQIQGNFWYLNYRKARDKYGISIDEILHSGNKALFLVRIEYHKIFGLKLNILDIDPAYSYGEMERQKQLNISRLKEENLYFKQKSLHLPRICRKIALIGSPETSGFRDFMKTLFDNDLYTLFQVKVFPSSVQGNEAKIELIKQIQEAQNYAVDAIVLIRGGGSKTDLNVFNDYDVAHAICVSRIPFVTGIGHETDDVICAHVSHLDCITPTAAAKHFFIQISGFLSDLRSSFDALIQGALVLLQAHRIEFSETQKRLGYFSQLVFKKQQTSLEELSQHLFRVVNFNLVSKFQDLEILLLHIEANAIKSISISRDIELEGILERIQISIRFRIERERQFIKEMDGLLLLLNPLQLLERGYSITTLSDRDIDAFEELQSGMEMKTLTHKYLITSTIQQILIKKNE